MQNRMMRSRFSRLWLLLIWSIGCISFTYTSPITPPAAAQTTLQLNVTPAFAGNYAPGTWLPLQIALTNPGPTITALVAAAPPESNTRYTLAVELPTGAAKTVTLYMAMEQETRSLLVTVEHAGTRLAEQEIEVRPRRNERLLGIVSDQPVQLALPRRQEMQQLPFVPLNLRPSELPDQAQGLSSLTLLLVSDLPAEALTEAQQQAITGWVARGGHLVIGGGATAQRTIATLPEALRPATLGAPQELDAEVLGTFVAAPGLTRLSGIQLEPLPGSIGTGSSTTPLWVQRDLGDGQITQLAFDPNDTALRAWAAAPAFWDRLLQPTRWMSGAFGREPTADRFQEQSLTSAIGNLPALNLPPTNILFGILVIYTILIGPGIALLLRRLDRQVWGWLVLPVLALLVTAIGAILAWQLRADQRIISQATLVEQIDADQARVRTVIGILTPQDEQFEIHIPPGALVRPLRSTSGSYGQIGGVTGDLLQQSPTITIQVPRWKMQGIIVEQQIAFPEVAGRIVLVGADTIPVQVENTTSQKLSDVSIVYGEQVVRFGAIPAGGRGDALWPFVNESADEQPQPGTALSYLLLGPQLDAGRRPGGVAERRVLLREAILTAAVTRGSQLPDIGPLVVAWLEQSPLETSVIAPGAARQHVTLLVTRPVIRGSGAVVIPPDWLRLNPEADERAVCSGDAGSGIQATPPVTATFQLPADLSTLQTTALTLTLESERTWPNVGVTTELFNWQQQRWVEVDFDGPGDLSVPDPEPYLFAGRLRLRLDGRIGEGGCLFARAHLTGSLP